MSEINLKSINNLYSKDKKQSLTEILETFQCIGKDQAKLSENIIKYSNADFWKCSKDEQKEFFNDQLQFIECLVINSIYEHSGITWNWGDIFKLLLNDSYAKTEKTNRKVVFPSFTNSRPVGDKAFMVWNGLQIIDLDIKDKELCDQLKLILFNELNQYRWFLGITKSASGKGIHIWTKITPLTIELDKRKIEFICNFRHKYSLIYMILLKHMNDLGYTKNNIVDYIDMAMAKPQQGIFISSDKSAMLNMNFIDDRFDKNFESAFDNGVESINWITHEDLKTIFSKLEWFGNDSFNKKKDIELSDVSNINDINYNLNKIKHYKHNQRWQLANTLTRLYGGDKAIEIMISICKGTDKRELMGDVKTAQIHNKPISLWAVQELNKNHGFNIKVKDEILQEQNENLNTKLLDKEYNEDPLKYLSNISTNNTVTLHINKNQYLSDIKQDIIGNLSQITLLEAGAGYGKTEMFKSLKEKTLLILPFTSTIKAKIENDDVTDDWLYFYGNKRPTIDDLFSNKSMSMTIDKFSRLNIVELDAANFKYIVIDESHLLFTSSYREVMGSCVQRLANCKSKVIMMTGTPTGEAIFFQGIKKIKVIKEDIRVKDFTVNFSPTPLEQLIDTCKNIGDDIVHGKKVLFPTNKGNLFYEQMIGLIRDYIDNNYKDSFTRDIRSFYYKKSNFGEEEMDKININKTIGEADIIFCTTYLSVGVDICDRYEFNVYFTDLYISQDIEQFANRLRNNDLHVKMMLPRYRNDGDTIPIDYYTENGLDLSFEESQMIYIRDLIRTCNDMIERNNDESKYNPLIQNLLSANKFLKYDENDTKYYIDETAYKLKVFEERYSDYAKQLTILMHDMKAFGYEIFIQENNERIPDAEREQYERYIADCRNRHFDYKTKQAYALLSHINDSNIDDYREAMSGNYDIYRAPKYKERREMNNLYVEDIEIVEKNMPIILSLYKYYDIPTITDIYDFCKEPKSNKLNYAKLQRIRRFINIEINRKRKRLDFPILRFLKDVKDWVNNNYATSSEEILKFLGSYAARYANSIKDVVIDDQLYFEEIFELVKDLWKVIVDEKKSKGMVHLTLFKLLWKNKNDIKNIWGNEETHQFFVNELLDNMKSEEIDESDLEGIKEFEHTDKKQLSDIKNEIPEIVHKEFDYYKYSELDKSNERFLRKQENTSQLHDKVFTNEESNEITYTNNKKQLTLFDKDDELPF